MERFANLEIDDKLVSTLFLTKDVAEANMLKRAIPPMNGIYELVGSYTKPYYYEDYFSQEENEIRMVLHYKHQQPIEMILGLYLTEQEARDAKHQYETHELITGESESWTMTSLPYKNVRYTKLRLGDRFTLPKSEPLDYRPVQTEDEVPEEDR